MFNLFGNGSVGSGMDFEGTTGNGLLGPGFDPRTMGLLNAAASMLKTSGPSATPTGLGQVLGHGFSGGLQGYGMGKQFEAMGEQSDLRKAQAAKLQADMLRQQRLASILSGGGQVAPAPAPQPTVEKSLGGPVTLTPVGLQQSPEARSLDAPAPQSPNPVDEMLAKGRQLIGAGFINEGTQIINAAAASRSKEDGPLSDLGKLAEDYRRGRITKEEYDSKFKKLTTHQPPIATIDLKQDTEFNKKVGGQLGEQYSDLLKADMTAPTNIAKYQRLGQLLGNVNTGKFKGTTLELKAAAKSMGVDLNALGIADDVAPAQAARALSNQIAMELRNPAGGAGMPGALSDKDREFLVASIPGLENDPAAIGKMIEYRVKLEQRAQRVARMARDYRRKNGRFDEGFYDELQDWSEKNRLFPDAPAPASGAKVIDFGSLK